jgi:hypothetical protein
MRRSTVLSFLLAVVLVPGLAHAQARPDPAPTLEAMKKAAFLAGDWQGSGWMQMGPAKEEFTQTESVKTMLDGAILLVEGIGMSKAAPAEKIHHAVGVIAYDPLTKEYRFSPFVAGRSPMSVKAEIGDGTLVWGFQPQPNIHVRYTITVKDGAWHEIGEYSPDGTNWSQFFEMTLTRR